MPSGTNPIEDIAIELFEKLGYQYIYAPDIAPDKVNGKAREGALGYSETPLPITISGEVRVEI